MLSSLPLYASPAPARPMRENVKHMLSAGADWRRPEFRETTIDPVAVALVLVAAVVHASWNRVLHAEDDRVAAMSVAGLVVGVILLPAVLISPPWRVLPFVVAAAAAPVC